MISGELLKEADFVVDTNGEGLTPDSAAAVVERCDELNFALVRGALPEDRLVELSACANAYLQEMSSNSELNKVMDGEDDNYSRTLAPDDFIQSHEDFADALLGIGRIINDVALRKKATECRFMAI